MQKTVSKDTPTDKNDNIFVVVSWKYAEKLNFPLTSQQWLFN